MTESQWLQLAAWITRIWPRHPIPPHTAAAWYPFLHDLDHTDVREAIARHAISPEGNWPPAIHQLRSNPQHDEHTHWLDAWHDLCNINSRGGPGRLTYHGPDPLVAEYINHLDQWRENFNPSDPALRAHFRDWYQHHTTRHAQLQREKLARNITQPALPAPSDQYHPTR